MTGVGMVLGESGKLSTGTSQGNFPDACSRVLGVPEVLFPILRYVAICEGTKANILRIAGVSHLWREVVCEILKSSGIPVHEFKCDKQPMTNWDEYEKNYPKGYARPVSLQSVNKDNVLEPGVVELLREFSERAVKLPEWDTYSVKENIPLGYLLPIGLEIADFKLHQSDIQQFLSRHSERIVKLKLIIFQSDLKLLNILEAFELDNLNSLELDFPECKRIWPEDIIRTVQSVLKISPKLKELSVHWDHFLGHETDPSIYVFQQHLKSKLQSRVATETHVWLLEKLRIHNDWGVWSSEFELILKFAASTIQELDLDMGSPSDKRMLLQDSLVFPNLRTIRLKLLFEEDFHVSANLLGRFPNLKFLHIEDRRYYNVALFDHLFPESMPIIPMVQALSYNGLVLSPAQCSILFTGLPNCIKLVIEWYRPDYGSRCIRLSGDIQLKTLEIYFRKPSVPRYEIAEHIDDWTFPGLEIRPKAPILKRIRIYTRFSETLSRTFY